MITSRSGAMGADRATRWLPAASVGPARWRVYRTSAWSCPEPDGRNGDGHTLYVKVGADRYLEMDDDN